MGLYLCIFDEDEEELDGVSVGSYADFGHLRDVVSVQLEGGRWGSRFPTLMMHTDCDGEWAPQESSALLEELRQISSELKSRPPIEIPSEWQKQVAKSVGLMPKSAFETFIDVDGEFLLDRLIGLAERSIDRGLPILFQ